MNSIIKKIQARHDADDAYKTLMSKTPDTPIFRMHQDRGNLLKVIAAVKGFADEWGNMNSADFDCILGEFDYDDKTEGEL